VLANAPFARLEMLTADAICLMGNLGTRSQLDL
jgi:hypothetical protein